MTSSQTLLKEDGRRNQNERTINIYVQQKLFAMPSGSQRIAKRLV
jgi:hypothetical protein